MGIPIGIGAFNQEKVLVGVIVKTNRSFAAQTPLTAGPRGRPGVWAAHRGVRGEGGSQLLDRGGGGHARGP